MAGEWLKFEKSTLDKPEVFAIADALSIDPDAVIGKLVRVWAWFDSHTVDGNAARVTPALLNRVSGIDGFIEAMAAEGWAAIDAGGVQLPRFDRHNGETAKQRALTAKRVARSRLSNGNSSATCNDPSVTSALAREEKRREDVEAKATVRSAAPIAPLDGLGIVGEPPIPDSPSGEEVPRRIRSDRKPQTADRFPEFWAAYPVKKGKPVSLKKWKAKGLDAIADQIIAHVRMMEREDDQWKRGFIPHGDTYINGERWTDEPYREGRVGTPAPSMPQGAKAAMATIETKLQHAISWAQQQYQRGDFGQGEEALEKLRAEVDAARRKYAEE